MGVLDEAIREHLELKRQRGASDAELARDEAEALGPARRGGAKVLPAEDAPSPAYGAAPRPDPEEHAETRLLQPLAPPDPSERRPAPDPELREPRVPVVHDIDEDPLAPPSPVVEPPIEDDVAEAPPVDDEPPADEADPTDDEQLWPDREPPPGRHDDR